MKKVLSLFLAVTLTAGCGKSPDIVNSANFGKGRTTPSPSPSPSPSPPPAPTVLPYEIYYTHTVTADPLWRRVLGIFIDGDPWLLRYAVTVVACLNVVIGGIVFVNSVKNVVENAISAIDGTIHFFIFFTCNFLQALFNTSR